MFVPKGPDILNPSSYPQVCQAQGSQQLDQMGMSPILDKILERLETIQATKCNQSSEDEVKKQSCCFVDPADGKSLKLTNF